MVPDVRFVHAIPFEDVISRPFAPTTVNSGESAVAAAAARGAEVLSLARYGREPQRPAGLVLGFAAVDPKEIGRGTHALAAALRSLPPRRRQG